MEYIYCVRDNKTTVCLICLDFPTQRKVEEVTVYMLSTRGIQWFFPYPHYGSYPVQKTLICYPNTIRMKHHGPLLSFIWKKGSVITVSVVRQWSKGSIFHLEVSHRLAANDATTIPSLRLPLEIFMLSECFPMFPPTLFHNMFLVALGDTESFEAIRKFLVRIRSRSFQVTCASLLKHVGPFGDVRDPYSGGNMPTSESNLGVKCDRLCLLTQSTIFADLCGCW